MEKDWGEINADVLRLIANKVGDVANFIWLRAVCKYWRSVVHPSDLPPQLPWFIVSDGDFTYDSLHVHKLFSIYSNQTYCLTCSKANVPMTSISSCSYLYKVDLLSGRKFFNPLTGLEVPFPFPWDFPSLIRTVQIFASSTSNNHLDKQGMDLMLSGPHTNRDFSWSGTRATLWRYCNKEWKIIFEVYCADNIRSLTYCNRKLYALNYNDFSQTNVIDVATSTIASVIKNPPHAYFDYLIDACGDLLGIQLHQTRLGYMGFEIYRLDDATKNPFWTKLIRGIGDRMLFLDNFIKGGFCLEASDFAGLRGNCIYINYMHESERGGLKVRLERCDLSQCKSEILEEWEWDYGYSTAWLVPSLC